jgi:hypothetical protein
LDAAFEERSPLLLRVFVDPRWEHSSISRDARFAELRARCRSVSSARGPGVLPVVIPATAHAVVSALQIISRRMVPPPHSAQPLHSSHL